MNTSSAETSYSCLPLCTDSSQIWAAKIGSSGPNVLLAGNIHGDETTGGQLLQRWMWETCNEPTPEQDQAAVQLVTWYIPMLNVDGYEKVREGVLSQLGPHCCNYHAAAPELTGARKQLSKCDVARPPCFMFQPVSGGRARQQRVLHPLLTGAPPLPNPRTSAPTAETQTSTATSRKCSTPPQA